MEHICDACGKPACAAPSSGKWSVDLKSKKGKPYSQVTLCMKHWNTPTFQVTKDIEQYRKAEKPPLLEVANRFDVAFEDI